ncbi:MAG: DUF1801 domain-containing protein [Planctomycetota bacterium]
MAAKKRPSSRVAKSKAKVPAKKAAAKKAATKKAPAAKRAPAKRAGLARAPGAEAAHEAYLAKLPPERAEALRAVREAIRKGLPPGYEEGMQYNMIAWYVPHSRYPAGYHCDPKQPVPFASIASQKSHIGLYLMCIYADDGHREQFISEWKASGKRLDMGKGCVRAKRLEDIPLDVVTRAVSRIPVDAFLAHYEEIIPPSKRRR